MPDAQPGETSTTTKVVERGGLARIATLVKQIRTENPNSVLMNIGDTYHGGVEAMYTTGNAIIDPVDALGIDVGVPGNWDFAYGPTATRQRYTDDGTRLDGDTLAPENEALPPNFPNLVSNVTYTFPPGKVGETICPPTLLMTIDGVSIGFIGITSDIVPKMHPTLATGFDFLQGESNYRDLINQHMHDLRNQGAQIVVVMSELGIQKDYRLADIIDPGVDVIFSAHTHEATFIPLTDRASGAWVVEAGNDGYLGRMDITVTDGQVTARNWQLIPVDSSIPEDAAMKALVDAARAPFLAGDVDMTDPSAASDQTLTQPIDTIVGHSEGALDRRHALESTFNNAFTDLLRRKTNTQLAITPGFRFDAIIEDKIIIRGAITLEDVYRFFPLAYTIATAEVTGLRLKEIMETVLTEVYSPEIFNQAGGWFEGYSGLSTTLNLANPDGSRIIDLRVKDSGEPILDDTKLTVTGCSRPGDEDDVLCSHSGFTGVTDLINPDTNEAWTVIDIFIDGLSAGILPRADRRDITDLNATAAWPETPYVQALTGGGQ